MAREDETGFEDDDRPRKPRRSDDDDDLPRRRRNSDDDDDLRVKRKGTLDRETLRSIAFYQRGILSCILIYIIAAVGFYFIPPDLKWIGLIIVVPLALTATVFVFLLAAQTYGPIVGVLLGLLTLVPCVGLLVLLIINSRATSTLQLHGIRVGLLGANSADL